LIWFLLLLWLWLLIFCPFGRLRYGIGPVTKVSRASASGPNVGAKPFAYFSLGRHSGVWKSDSLCESETASGSTRINGYAPIKILSAFPATSAVSWRVSCKSPANRHKTSASGHSTCARIGKRLSQKARNAQASCAQPGEEQEVRR
jgi:hypothetical protein